VKIRGVKDGISRYAMCFYSNVACPPETKGAISLFFGLWRTVIFDNASPVIVDTKSVYKCR